MTTQTSYSGSLGVDIDTTTGVKVLRVTPAPAADNLTGFLKVSIGLTTVEWFQVTDTDATASTITTGSRGLQKYGSLTELAGSRKEHFKGANIAIVTFHTQIHDQNTDTGTTSTTFEIDSGGDSVTLDTTGQTSDHNFTFPDSSGETTVNEATQTLTNKTLTSPTITAPTINTSIAGTAFQTTVGNPGVDTLGVTEKAVRDAIIASVAGVASINSATGAITLTGGVDITITESPSGTFTLDSDNNLPALTTAGDMYEYISSVVARMPSVPATLADGATVTVDFSASKENVVTLGGNRIIAISNEYDGAVKLLTIKQDGTGSRTVTWKYSTETVAYTAVDTGTDAITVANDYQTGTKVQISTDDTLPTGLSASTDYYLIRVDATHVQFATTRANAFAGTDIDITAQGAGNHTIELYAHYDGGVAPVLTTTAYAEDKFMLLYDNSQLKVIELGLDFN